MDAAIVRYGVPTSHLELVWTTRHGSASPGALKRERRYLDYIVDGQSLLASLGGGDYVKPFGWLPLSIVFEVARRLLLEVPAVLDDRRQELYVCPECADLGCGAITAVVQRADDCIVWSDFGYQRGPNASDVVRDRYGTVGPLVFGRSAYARTIRSALRRSHDTEGT